MQIVLIANTMREKKITKQVSYRLTELINRYKMHITVFSTYNNSLNLCMVSLCVLFLRCHVQTNILHLHYYTYKYFIGTDFWFFETFKVSKYFKVLQRKRNERALQFVLFLFTHRMYILTRTLKTGHHTQDAIHKISTTKRNNNNILENCILLLCFFDSVSCLALRFESNGRLHITNDNLNSNDPGICKSLKNCYASAWIPKASRKTLITRRRSIDKRQKLL